MREDWIKANAAIPDDADGDAGDEHFDINAESLKGEAV